LTIYAGYSLVEHMKQSILSIQKLTLLATVGVVAFANIGLSTVVYAQESDAKKRNIIQSIEADDELSTLETVLKTAKIQESIAFTDNITILAPTNEAFAKIPEPIRTNLLKEENRDKLLKVLRYHVVLTDVEKDQLDDNKDLVTLLGTESVVKLTQKDGKTLVNDKVSAGSLNENPENGSILKINEVLIPTGFDINSLNMVVDATPRTGGISISLAILTATIVLASSSVFATKQLGYHRQFRWN
jgi:uncharacterized surface protein with fasciclin (FAS1) repeats